MRLKRCLRKREVVDVFKNSMVVTTYDDLWGAEIRSFRGAIGWKITSLKPKLTLTKEELIKKAGLDPKNVEVVG